MALTSFPIPDQVVVTAEAIATATAVALSQQDIGKLLTDILTELKIHTTFMQNAFNILDDPRLYRNDPDHQL